MGDNWVWLMVNYKDNCIYLSIPSNEVTVTHCLQIPRRVTYLDFTSLSIFLEMVLFHKTTKQSSIETVKKFLRQVVFVIEFKPLSLLKTESTKSKTIGLHISERRLLRLYQISSRECM